MIINGINISKEIRLIFKGANKRRPVRCKSFVEHCCPLCLEEIVMYFMNLEEYRTLKEMNT